MIGLSYALTLSPLKFAKIVKRYGRPEVIFYWISANVQHRANFREFSLPAKIKKSLSKEKKGFPYQTFLTRQQR